MQTARFIQSEYTYSFRILAILLFGCLFVRIFSNSDDPTLSFVSGTFIFLLLTSLSAKLILVKKKWVRFFTVVFLAKISLSLCHYLFFIDADYFSGDGSLPGSFWHEYQSVYNQVSEVVKTKKAIDNIFYFDNDSFEVTHPEIWNLISFPLFYLGSFVLTLAPINIYFSVLLSINIVFVSERILSYDTNKVKAIAWTCSFFPLFLLGDIFYRDQIGMGLISIGLSMYFVSDKKIIEKALSIVLILYCSYILRTLYPLVFLISVVFYLIFMDKRKSLVFLAIIALFLFFYSVNEFLPEEEYFDNYITTTAWLFLPVKIIFGLIGPFPWTQFFKYRIDPAISYQITDYILGIFQLTYFSLIIKNRKSLFVMSNMNVLTFFGLCIAMSGVITKQMHIGYIAEGILLTVPWFFSSISIKDFGNRLYRVFLLLVILNVIVELIGGNVGISALWK